MADGRPWDFKDKSVVSHKKCLKCQLILPVDKFAQNKKSMLGRRAQCRSCERVEVKCGACGETRLVAKSRTRAKICRKCAETEMGRKYLGVKHGLLNGQAWQKVRWASFERDGFKCIRCGESKPLQGHHIKPKTFFPELALVVGNVVSLCLGCHEKAELANAALLDANPGIDPRTLDWQPYPPL
jgi:5-methylcytosine-specific restriction endonuclease McrA